MTSGDSLGEPRLQRTRLGSELWRLRRLAGLSGKELASQIGIGQASVSRIETGQTVPSLPQVTAWAEATSASPDARAALTALTEAALNEVETWRVRIPHDGLPGMQEDVRTLEATAGAVRIFQPAIVPALLQTAEYARHVFKVSDVTGAADYPAAVAARLERQQLLHDESHEFEFVLTEAALRWRLGPAAMIAAQLDRIANIASLSNVTVRVIADGTELQAIPWCGFNIYENRQDARQPIVTIEIPHARLTVADEADVAIYGDQLAQLRHSAVSGKDAVELIQTVSSRLA
jgi:transcriptional regulator with XRE-family HTH domain